MTIEHAQLDAIRFNANQVDRDNKIIRGVKIAELGEFRSGRGAFDQEALQKITQLVNNDKDGKMTFLGHVKDGNDVERPFLGKIINAVMDGNATARGDLKIADLAMKATTSGGTPPGEYIMDLAEQEPRALEMSLCLSYSPKKKKIGKSPVWNVVDVTGCDVVRKGDATRNGLLNADDPSGTVDDPANEKSSDTLEDSTLALDQETKNFIAETVKSSVNESVTTVLSAIEAKRKKDEAEQANLAKAEKGELAVKSNGFLQRAMKLGMDSEKAIKISGEITEGKLSFDSAIDQLADFACETKKLDEDGGGDAANLSFDKKVEAQLSAEWKDCQPQFESLELSFEDYKEQNEERIKAELAEKK